jgi:purine-binding chemotaxis protein CheW
MVEMVTQIERRLQTVQSKNGRYLTFTFLETKRGMELGVEGWTELKPLPDKPDYIKGVINPWGPEIPVIDLRALYRKRPTKLTSTTCIIIFEHVEAYKYYFGMTVNDLSSVVNIADGTENRMLPLLLSAERYLSVRPAVGN